MNKFCLIISIALLGTYASLAQQATDPVSGQAPLQKDEAFTFSDFSCVLKNTGNVELQWKMTNNNADGDYFVVERSVDGDHFETVGALKISDTITGYALIDNSPYNGSDFYRIKYISKSGKSVYSKVSQVNLSASVDFKFYPNPVDKLLIIRTSHNIDIDIIDAAGSTRLNKQIAPGLQIVNTASLEKGVYVLKIADKESNRIISEQLVKN
ncbi:MAG TPA: T9SS type A sorting domain-containing protein [Puia sp.]|nr:T9SS type A sorting domain-containing protein [Puia sp.]